MIVKVQLPLVTSETKPKALIYNSDRSVYLMVDVDHVVGMLKGRNKAFFEASINEKKELVLGKEVDKQD